MQLLVQGTVKISIYLSCNRIENVSTSLQDEEFLIAAVVAFACFFFLFSDYLLFVEELKLKFFF